jgi:transposase
VTIKLTVTRLKCLNLLCSRRTFAGSIPGVTGPRARRTSRVSNGQTEGQISRLKTMKRAMYGRAGITLLRARMLPLQTIN